MSAEAQGLQIPISMSLDEARAALAQLEQMARQAGRGVQAGIGGAKPATDAGTASLSKYKEGLSRSREAAMFFTSALGELGPAGRTAQIAVSGLAGAFLGGGGILLALEGARVGVRLFSDYLSEAKEEIRRTDEEIGRMVETATGRVGTLREELLRLRRGEQAVADERFRAEVRRINQEIAAERARTEAMFGGQTLNVTDRYIALKAERDALVKAWQEERKLRADVEEEKDKDSKARGARAAVRATSEVDTEAATRFEALRRQRQREAELEVAAIDAIEDAKDAARARREELRRAASLMTGTFAEAGGNLGQAGQLQALYTESAAKLAQIREMEAEGVLLTQDAERMRTAIVEEQARRRGEILRNESQAMQQVQQMGVNALKAFATAATTEFGKSLRSSRAYERAMADATGAAVEGADLSATAFAAMAQDALASVAAESTGRAAFETAMGLAMLARAIWDPTAGAAAGKHFAAAAAFGAVGGVTAGAAALIGNNRGMTSAERASVDAARLRNEDRDTPPDAPPDSSSRLAEQGGGVRSATEAAPQVEKHFIYVGDPFLTPAENARMIARRIDLMERLDLRRTS